MIVAATRTAQAPRDGIDCPLELPADRFCNRRPHRVRNVQSARPRRACLPDGGSCKRPTDPAQGPVLCHGQDHCGKRTGGLQDTRLRGLRRGGRSRRRHHRGATRRRRRPSYHGECAAQGLHRAHLPHDHGGVRQAHGDRAGAPPADHPAPCHRHRRRRADQGRQRRDRGSWPLRLARRRRALRQCRHRQSERISCSKEPPARSGHRNGTHPP